MCTLSNNMDMERSRRRSLRSAFRRLRVSRESIGNNTLHSTNNAPPERVLETHYTAQITQWHARLRDTSAVMTPCAA